MLRRSVVRYLAVAFVPVSVALAAAAATGNEFGDDDGGVHEPAIDALAAEGVFEGTECGDGLFCPEAPVLRWVMGVWLVRTLGSTSAESGSRIRFSDVDPGEWWAPYVERLADLGISAGCATGPLRYCPDSVVTRAQMATFLTRAFEIEEGPPSGFADTSGNVHERSIDALAAAGVTAGCSTDPPRFCPGQQVTRAQLATFLDRARELREPPEPAGGYTAVATGRWHTCGLRTDGSIKCWGANSWGQADAPPGAYTAVAAGHRHNCALRTDGAVRCWGNDYRGLTRAPPGAYTAITSGHGHNCGLLTDGTVNCWGDTDHGLTQPPPGVFAALSTGPGATCGLHADRTLRCWGGPYHYGNSEAPAGAYTAVASGSRHSCALRPGGAIHCWGGRDYYGETDVPEGPTPP